MAVVHTDMPGDEPGHQGESDFARWVSELGDDRLHLWFGLDYLPGVSDVDVFACHVDIGFFAIEVKAVTIDALEEYGPGHCRIRGRSGTRTPLQQARKAQIRLTEYLRDVVGLRRAPFIHVTAAWPRISRLTFIGTWRHPAVEAQAQSMLFNEELRELSKLEDRLRQVVAKPPLGAPGRAAGPVSAEVLDAVITALSPRANPSLGSRDESRVRHLEEQLRRSVRTDFAPGQAEPVVFTGAPGTGKTFRLLEVALAHAEQDRNVLFACYNKALGADLRRLLYGSPQLQQVQSNIDVVDIEQLFQRYKERTGDLDGSYEKVRSLGVAEIRASGRPDDEYATILVDEAQDLRQWAFELLDWVAATSADWFIAHGRGQSLYIDEPAVWLQEFEQRARQVNLRRVFRTARAEFLVAQCVHELSPNRDEIDAWLDKRMPPQQPSSEQLALELDQDFERVGAPPMLIQLQVDTENPEGPTTRWRAEQSISEYRRLIEEELSRLERLGEPGDLLVLVPGTHQRRSEGRWACQALEDLGAEYVDLVEEDERRTVVQPGEVRVLTYHSARGIEASRVLIFGFEALNHGTEARQRNLGYIALSRARHGSTIALSPHSTGAHVDFVKAVVTRLEHRLTEQRQDAPPANSSASSQERRLDWRTGYIARLNPDRQFGFLIDDRTREEIFFHFSSLFDLSAGRLTQGLRLHYAHLDTDRGRRASMLSSEVPEGLDMTPGMDGSIVTAVLVERIGERGFGFLLSPYVEGRIFVHRNQLVGVDPLDLDVGATVLVKLDATRDSRPRAASAWRANPAPR